MKYFVATQVNKKYSAQYYIEHRVHHYEDRCWTYTSSTDVISNATAFSTKEEAEKIRDAAYINPVGDHGTKHDSIVVGITDKQLFKSLLSRGTRRWIGQT